MASTILAMECHFKVIKCKLFRTTKSVDLYQYEELRYEKFYFCILFLTLAYSTKDQNLLTSITLAHQKYLVPPQYSDAT